MDTDSKQSNIRRIHDMCKELYTIHVAVLVFVIIMIIVSAILLSLASAYGQYLLDLPAPERVVFELLALCITPTFFGLIIIIVRVVFHRWI